MSHWFEKCLVPLLCFCKVGVGSLAVWPSYAMFCSLCRLEICVWNLRQRVCCLVLPWGQPLRWVCASFQQTVLQQVISNSAFVLVSPPSLLITFLLYTCMWVCACAGVCRCGVREIYTILWLCNDYFWGFNVYIFVDLVKHAVLSLVGEIWHYRNDSYHYFILRLPLTCLQCSLVWAVYVEIEVCVLLLKCYLHQLLKCYHHQLLKCYLDVIQVLSWCYWSIIFASYWDVIFTSCWSVLTVIAVLPSPVIGLLTVIEVLSMKCYLHQLLKCYLYSYWSVIFTLSGSLPGQRHCATAGKPTREVPDPSWWSSGNATYRTYQCQGQSFVCVLWIK